MRRRCAAILLGLLLPGSTLLAEDFWVKKRDFHLWTEREVRKMLTDSPWARPVLVPVESAAGPPEHAQRPGCTRCEIKSGGISVAGAEMAQLSRPLSVIVRWRSALPVKQALARSQLGDEVEASQAAAEYLGREEPAYLAHVIGLPPSMLPAEAGQLKKDAFLRVRGKPPIPAQDVQGSASGVLLVFPKHLEGAPAVTLADGQVEVQLRLGALDIRRVFKLKDMVYAGKFEM